MANQDGNAGNGMVNNDNDVNAHPYPVPITNLPEALKLIRKYNGKSDVNEWLLRFDTDLKAFSVLPVFIAPGRRNSTAY